MESKLKFIVIGLITVVVAMTVYAFSLLSSREALRKEYLFTKDTLTRENEELTKRANTALQEKREIEEKWRQLQAQLDELVSEKQELQSKYDLLFKERGELAEMLKKMPITTAVLSTSTAPVTTESDNYYWAEILKTKTELELQLENLRGDLKNMQATGAQMQKDKSNLELELSNLNRENADLKRQIEYNQKIMDSLAAELVREKNDKFQIQENIKPIREENNILRQQIKGLNNRRMSLEKKIQELQDENTRLQTKSKEAEELLKSKLSAPQFDAEGKLSTYTTGIPAVPLPQHPGLSESVELSPIVVRPPQTAVSATTKPALEGKVLAVNRDNNFVIIDLGSDMGVMLGDTFKVYRQDKNISTIEVIQTRNKIAACDIKKEVLPIRVGDRVK